MSFRVTVVQVLPVLLDEQGTLTGVTGRMRKAASQDVSFQSSADVADQGCRLVLTGGHRAMVRPVADGSGHCGGLAARSLRPSAH